MKRFSDLLTSESAWINGVMARDSSGQSIAPESKLAVSWSLFGACCALAGGYHNTEAFETVAKALRSACAELFGAADFVAFESSASWAEIEQLIRRADAVLNQT